MGEGMARLGRDALLREVLAVIARAPAASMAEVAAELGVGRTTLYRHFGDRETMIAEVARSGARAFGDALMSARPAEGPGLEAVERVCAQLFALPDVLTLMFTDTPVITDEIFDQVERERIVEAGDDEAAPGTNPLALPEGDPLEAIIRRGQGDGSITDEVPAEWAAMHVFLTIGSGHLYAMTLGGTTAQGDRSRALDFTIRAIRRTLAVD